MHKELCILHANCQGQPLGRLLLASPGFQARWRIRGVLNYKRESLSDADLDAATLFIYQNLTMKWEVLASANVLKRLSPSATTLCIPNPFFKGYWPFWTNRDPAGGVLRFGDTYLEHLINMGLDLSEISHIYLNTSLTRKYDLDSMLEESCAIEAKRETPCAFKTLPWVLEHWRTEQVCSTINHPSPRLLRFMADRVLEQLGLPPLTDAQVQALLAETPDAISCDVSDEIKLEQPIHPQVAAHYGLPFGGPDARYMAWGKRVSFKEYTIAYVDMRLRGEDLIPGDEPNPTA